MEVIHHAAVSATWAAFGEDAEYHPFSGYGHHGRHYPVAAPFRGYSTIPHHVAVESREEGERNGRIFFASSPVDTGRRSSASTNGHGLRANRVFRMDARHGAIAGPPAETIIHLPEFVEAVERHVARARPEEATVVRSRGDDLVGTPA